MKYIDEIDLSNKVVLVRVDFNVPLSPALTVEDDQRIRASLPTIQYLLDKKCKIILMSHLGRPDGVVNKLSLRPVALKLQELMPNSEVKFIEDMHHISKKQIEKAEQEIFLLENLRFFKEEQDNDPEFAKRLSYLADVYVNDAFSVSHRADASVVGITKLLPSYGGLLLKKELVALQKLLQNPEKPFVAILGGSKISGKLGLIEKLAGIVDTILVGGGIANTFLFAQGNTIGKSICEKDMTGEARRLVDHCKSANVSLIVPIDLVIGQKEGKETQIKNVSDVLEEDAIYDIGPKTQDAFRKEILGAKTIVWNGPVGYFENPAYIQGTNAIYNAIAENATAFSVVGGGDTLSYLADRPQNDKISFISTGGGAMLEYLAKGTLPGLQALN